MLSKEEKKELLALQQDTPYYKSNYLIDAKYRSTAMEEDLMTLAYGKMKEARIEKDAVILTLTAREIRKELNISRDSFYEDLDACASRMTGRSLGMSDPVNKRFSYKALIISSDYEDGVLTMKFNPDLKDYLIKTDFKNLTKVSKKARLTMKSVYSKRLYEILKSHCFYYKGQERPDNRYVVNYSIAELKLLIGVVNANLDSVKRVLGESDNPDYEKAVSRSPEKMYNRWSDFKGRVLDPAVKEINKNEYAGMKVDYVLQKSGKGGKTTGITFIIELAEDFAAKKIEEKEEKKSREITEEVKEEAYEYVSELFKNEGLTFREYRAIAEAAEYDSDRISNAYEIMRLQPGGIESIENKTGWMIAALKENYEVNEAELKRSRKYFEEAKQRLIDEGLTKDYSQMVLFEEDM